MFSPTLYIVWSRHYFRDVTKVGSDYTLVKTTRVGLQGPFNNVSPPLLPSIDWSSDWTDTELRTPVLPRWRRNAAGVHGVSSCLSWKYHEISYEINTMCSHTAFDIWQQSGPMTLCVFIKSCAFQNCSTCFQSLAVHSFSLSNRSGGQETISLLWHKVTIVFARTSYWTTFWARLIQSTS
jgi:hypothetical protein